SRMLEGHTNSIRSVAFSPDGKTLASASLDHTLRLRSLGSALEAAPLGSLYNFDDGTWAVVDASGRYDASNAGDVEGLHWVIGNEPLVLRQLREGFYTPSLLSRLLHPDPENPLPEPPVLRDLKLYPKVSLLPPAPGRHTWTIRLTNRGGGL